MIWESHYWKEDLVRLARRLRERKRQKRWPERSLAKLEKEIFIGCYAVRKLNEAKKLSDRIANKKVLAESFQANGRKRITLFDWNTNFIEAYALEKPNKVKVSLMFLCNQLIHSYVFVMRLNDDGTLAGFYVNSDRERRRTVYYLPLRTFTNLFSMVGRDYPSHSRATFDQVTGDFVIKNW